MRKGKQLYMEKSIWELVEESAKKDNRSTNKWIEIHLTGYFLKEKLKKS